MTRYRELSRLTCGLNLAGEGVTPLTPSVQLLIVAQYAVQYNPIVLIHFSYEIYEYFMLLFISFLYRTLTYISVLNFLITLSLF